MYQLLLLFWDICLLKKGPQDIPYSNGLLPLLIISYSCISFLLLILNTGILMTIMQICVEVMLVLGLSRLILLAAKKIERYQQTVNALMATDALISFLALPAMASLIGQGTMIPFLAIVLLMIWHWVVSGHIFSQALDSPFAFGLGVSFLYVLTSYQIMGLIFPEMFISE